MSYYINLFQVIRDNKPVVIHGNDIHTTQADSYEEALEWNSDDCRYLCTLSDTAERIEFDDLDESQDLSKQHAAYLKSPYLTGRI